MTFIDNFASEMTSTLTVTAITSKDMEGVPVLGAVTTHAARVRRGVVRVETPQGVQERTQAMVIIAPPAFELTEEGFQYELDEGPGPVEIQPWGIMPKKDETGDAYVRLHF